ncbi:protein of unknown function [Burkholderia multivorans]
MCAFAHSREPSEKIRIALKNTRRVPSVSASQPDTGIITAIVSEYAMTTDCILSGDSPRLAAIDGSAVLTIVASSVCMKKPVATSQSMMVRFFSPGTAAGGRWNMEAGGGARTQDSRHCRETRPLVQVRLRSGRRGRCAGRRLPVGRAGHGAPAAARPGCRSSVCAMCVVEVKRLPSFVAEMVSSSMQHIVDTGLLE